MLECYQDIYEDSRTVSTNLNTFHQKLPFNAVCCGFYHTGDRYFTKRDGMDNYLLIVTVDGEGEIFWKGKSHILNKGSAVIIDCNVYHEYKTSRSEEWRFYFLHFNAITMSGYSNVLLKALTPVNLLSPERAYAMMDELCRICSSAQSKTYFLISNIISMLLTEMVCSVTEDDKKNMSSARADITELQKYIEENFASELGIDDFMSRTNLSRHYLIHMFKDHTGISPCRYMHMCRINASQKLLTDTDLSVSQISEAVGYGSTAVFIRHFKDFNNITPQKYRKEFYFVK